MGQVFKTDDEIEPISQLPIGTLRAEWKALGLTHKREADGSIIAYEPYRHQLATWGASRDNDHWALMLEMGLGKSIIIIATILWQIKSRGLGAAILIGRKGQYMNWLTDELPKYWPDGVLNPIRVEMTVAPWKSYMLSADYKRVERLGRPEGGFKILCISVESFQGARCLAWVDWFLELGMPTLAVLDESTTIKHHKTSKRAKAIINLGKKAWKLGGANRIMTGTPLPETPLDAFGQFEFMANGLLGQTSMTAFRSKYAIMERKVFGNRSFPVVTGYHKTDELHEIMMQHGTRYTKEECLDLPPKIYLPRWIDLCDEQASVYRSLQKELCAWFEDGGWADASSSLHKMIKLHQCSCGFVQLEDKSIRRLENERIPAMMEALEDVSGPVILWATYRESFKMAYEAIAEGYGEESIAQYWGGQELEANRARFMDGRARFFLGNPSVGGYGLTMTHASHNIYISNGYKAEERQQSEDRSHRIGQTKSVTYEDIVCRGTVDVPILVGHLTKREMSARVLKDAWSGWVNVGEDATLSDVTATFVGDEPSLDFAKELVHEAEQQVYSADETDAFMRLRG